MGLRDVDRPQSLLLSENGADTGTTSVTGQEGMNTDTGVIRSTLLPLVSPPVSGQEPKAAGSTIYYTFLPPANTINLFLAFHQR